MLVPVYRKDLLLNIRVIEVEAFKVAPVRLGNQEDPSEAISVFLGEIGQSLCLCGAISPRKRGASVRLEGSRQVPSDDEGARGCVAVDGLHSSGTFHLSRLFRGGIDLGRQDVRFGHKERQIGRMR